MIFLRVNDMGVHIKETVVRRHMKNKLLSNINRIINKDISKKRSIQEKKYLRSKKLIRSKKRGYWFF